MRVTCEHLGGRQVLTYIPVLTDLEAEENSSTFPGSKFVYRFCTQVMPFMSTAKNAPPTKTACCQTYRPRAWRVKAYWSRTQRFEVAGTWYPTQARGNPDSWLVSEPILQELICL